MRTTANGKPKRRARILLAAAVVMIAGMVAFPPTAQANQSGHRGHDSKKYHKRNVIQHHHRHAHPRVTVPRRLHHGRDHHYQKYYGGRVYYAPHRHHHYMYRFPVHIGGRVVYRAYYYCGDDIFLHGTVRLPHMAFGVTFGAPGGFYIGGHYRY